MLAQQHAVVAVWVSLVGRVLLVVCGYVTRYGSAYSAGLRPR